VKVELNFKATLSLCVGVATAAGVVQTLL